MTNEEERKRPMMKRQNDQWQRGNMTKRESDEENDNGKSPTSKKAER